jgi:hypothetical protein
VVVGEPGDVVATAVSSFPTLVVVSERKDVVIFGSDVAVVNKTVDDFETVVDTGVRPAVDV